MQKGRAMLGSVVLDVVETENPDYKNEVSERAVEEGVNISDHVKNSPIAFSISGVVTSPDAAKKRQELVTYRNNKQLLRYVGRNILENMVIEDLATSHTVENRNGFAFRIQLKQVRIVKSRTVAYVAPDPVRPGSGTPAIKTQVQDWSDAGLKNTVPQKVDKTKRQSLLLQGIGSLRSILNKVGK